MICERNVKPTPCLGGEVSGPAFVYIKVKGAGITGLQ
jgi:hypothetical protein